MDGSQPIPGWRPMVGERVIISETNWPAEILAELPADRFEVGPDIAINVLQPDNVRENYHRSELRPEHPTKEQLGAMYP